MLEQYPYPRTLADMFDAAWGRRGEEPAMPYDYFDEVVFTDGRFFILREAAGTYAAYVSSDVGAITFLHRFDDVALALSMGISGRL